MKHLYSAPQEQIQKSGGNSFRYLLPKANSSDLLAPRLDCPWITLWSCAEVAANYDTTPVLFLHCEPPGPHHVALCPISLTSVTSVQPLYFKSVILAWQHKTADLQEIWQRQTGSNYGALSSSKLCESFNSRNISVLLCEDGNTAPVYRGYYENEVICTIKSIVHYA